MIAFPTLGKLTGFFWVGVHDMVRGCCTLSPLLRNVYTMFCVPGFTLLLSGPFMLYGPQDQWPQPMQAGHLEEVFSNRMVPYCMVTNWPHQASVQVHMMLECGLKPYLKRWVFYPSVLALLRSRVPVAPKERCAFCPFPCNLGKDHSPKEIWVSPFLATLNSPPDREWFQTLSGKSQAPTERW
jgi:hypothetical protein